MADDNTAGNMTGKGTVRWTDSATSLLLECLRSRESLWNTRVESYRDRNKKKAEHECLPNVELMTYVRLNNFLILKLRWL